MRRCRFCGLSSGPTAATPPAAAALEVPTAGVPTYRTASPLRAAEVVGAAVRAAGAAGAAGRAVAADAAAAGAAAAGAAVSPSNAATSASVKGGSPVRLRRACSAATDDLLHFRPPAVNSATAALTAAAVAAGAAGAGVAGAAGVLGAAVAGVVLAGASPRSHGIGSPAFRAAISSSDSTGRPFRFRKACSAAMTELFKGLRGRGGRLPSTPFTVVESAIPHYPFWLDRAADCSVCRHDPGVSHPACVYPGSFHDQVRQRRDERRRIVQSWRHLELLDSRRFRQFAPFMI